MHVTVGGINTHYQQLGTAKTRLVLLHGWGCNWEIWSPIITTLTEKYQLIIPDLPAFGTSGNPPTVWDLQTYSQWLAEFINQISPQKPVIVIGHSFGAKVASWWAGQQPASLHKLVLVAAAGLPEALSPKQRLQQQALKLIPISVKKALPRSLKTKFLKLTGSADDHLNSTPTQRAILRQTIRQRVNDALVNISVPTLLLWGKLDQDTPISQAQQFQALIPQAELEIFETAGHFPFVDEPAKFIDRLTTFIES